MLNRVVSFFQHDPAVATLLTTIGMSFLTGALFLVKRFFTSIMDYINIHFVVSVSVSNRESIYYHLLDELVSIKPNLIKRLKLVGTQSDQFFMSNIWNTQKSVDGFYSYFFYKPFVPVKLFCTVKEKENTLEEKVELYIVFFMWNRKYLLDLMDKAIKRELEYNFIDGTPVKDRDNLVPYLYKDHVISSSNFVLSDLYNSSFSSFYSFFNVDKAKTFDDLYLPEDVLNSIKGRFDRFYNSRELYKKHNTPYRLGVLLYGKPGTGKTSIVKAIAHHYKKPIMFIDVKQISRLAEVLSSFKRTRNVFIESLFLNKLFQEHKDKLKDKVNFSFSKFREGLLEYSSLSSLIDISYEDFTSLLKKCEDVYVNIVSKIMPIIVIEDIDCIPSFTKRKDNKSLKDSLPEDVEDLEKVIVDDNGEQNNVFNDLFYDNMSTILNVLDGVVPHSDFVIIGTTNRIDVIDDAFKRPGRFDVVIEIPPISEETFALFCKANYPNSKLPRTFKLKEDVSMAYLQEDHFKGLTFEEIKEKYLA